MSAIKVLAQMLWMLARHPIAAFRGVRDYQWDLKPPETTDSDIPDGRLASALRDVFGVYLMQSADGEPHHSLSWRVSYGGQTYMIMVHRADFSAWEAATLYRRALVDAGVPVPRLDDERRKA